jgi:hypothetical protein
MHSYWSQTGNYLHLQISGNKHHPTLPPGVYVIQVSKEGMFLEHRPDGFELPPKLYGVEDAFIQRVANTFRSSKRNLGVLLTGLRGTGKTVTAELIAQEIGLPIILITQDMPGLVDFIDSIPHPATYVCDEFEKIFPYGGKGELSLQPSGGRDERGPSKLLPLMDGVLNSKHQKVFLLTTNSLSVEPNMVDRPGRIRYLRAFGNLPRATIEMIVEDKLNAATLRNEVIEYIAQLETITIDIVLAVIEEMNIHGGSPESLDGIFNVTKLEQRWDVTRIDMETMDEVKTRYGVRVSPEELSEASIGSSLEVDDRTVGKITKIEGQYVSVCRKEILEEYKNNGYEIKEEEQHEQALLRIKPVRKYNAKSFGHEFKGAHHREEA